VLQDLKYSVRMLRQTPGFSALAVFVLALGIGVNTAIFSLVNAVLFRPPAVRTPSELRYVYANPPIHFIRYADYRALLGISDVFSGVVGVSRSEAKLGSGADVRLVNGEAVTANYFEILGVRPKIGRAFSPALDEAPNAERAVIISARVWARDYHSDPNVVGTRLVLTRRGVRAEDQWPTYTIVGVAPEGFTGVASPWAPSDYWVPSVQRVSDFRTVRTPTGRGELRVGTADDIGMEVVIGRLNAGVDHARAVAAVRTLGESLRRANHPTVMDWSLTLLDSRRVRLPFDPRGQIVPERLAAGLMAVAGVVLVIAVANLAGMLLARGVTRRTEMALRLTLGGSRWQVARRLLTESSILAAAGGVSGVLLAKLLLIVFMDQTPSGFGRYEAVPTTLDVSIDPIVLVYTSVLCIGVALLVGLGPARQAWKTDLLSALASGLAAAPPKRTRVRLRHLVLVPQVCLSTALLLVAGVLARPLIEAERVDPGYNADGVATIDFGFNDRPRRNLTIDEEQVVIKEMAERRARFHQRVFETLEAHPGVSSFAVTMGLPTGSHHTWVTSRDAFPRGPHWYPSEAYVSEGYFETLGIKLVAGRAFDRRDTAGTPTVAVICETLAMWFWPGENAVGRYLGIHWPDAPETPSWIEVVGVVREVQPPVTTGLSNPFVYFPIAQRRDIAQTFIARGPAPPGELMQALRQAMSDADPTVEIYRSSMLTEAIASMLYPRRMAAGILMAAGVIGLLLSAAGLYGVISYSVVQRLRELGIRATLGANPISLIALVLREGGRIAIVGVVLGLAVAYFGMRAASKLVVEIPKLDQVTLVVVPVILGLVVLAACFVPARRASRVDPIVVLRNL
jgi:predicted permease